MKPYVLIGSGDLEVFEGLVNNAVADGYAPQGGLSIEHFTTWVEGMDGDEKDIGHHYMQAMYKKPAKTVKTRGSRKSDYSDDFEKFWKAYPKTSGANKKKAYAAWKKRLEEGESITDIMTGMERYKAFIEVTDRWVMLPATFLGPDNNYLLDWSLPTKTETLPRDNDQLVNWATQKGYRAPRPGETFPEYRQAIERLYRAATGE